MRVYWCSLVLVLLVALSHPTFGATDIEPIKEPVTSHSQNQWSLQAGSVHFYFQKTDWLNWVIESTLISFLMPSVLQIPNHLSLLGMNHNIQSMMSIAWLLEHLGKAGLQYYGLYQLFSTLQEVRSDALYAAQTLWSGIPLSKHQNLSCSALTPAFEQTRSLEIHKDTQGHFHINVPEYLSHPRHLVKMVNSLPMPALAIKYSNSGLVQFFSQFTPGAMGRKLSQVTLDRHLEYSYFLPRKGLTSWVSPQGRHFTLCKNLPPRSGETSLVKLPPQPPAQSIPESDLSKAIISFSSNKGSGNNRGGYRGRGGRGGHHSGRQSRGGQASHHGSRYQSYSGGGGGNNPQRPSDYRRKPPQSKPAIEQKKVSPSANLKFEPLPIYRREVYARLDKENREQICFACFDRLFPLISSDHLHWQVIIDSVLLGSNRGEELFSAMDSAGIRFRQHKNPGLLSHPFETSITTVDVQSMKSDLDAQLRFDSAPGDIQAGTGPDDWFVFAQVNTHKDLENMLNWLQISAAFGSQRAAYFYAGLVLYLDGHWVSPELRTRTLLTARQLLRETPYWSLDSDPIPCPGLSDDQKLILTKLSNINSANKPPELVLYGSHAYCAHLWGMYKNTCNITPSDWDFKASEQGVKAVFKSLNLSDTEIEFLTRPLVTVAPRLTKTYNKMHKLEITRQKIYPSFSIQFFNHDNPASVLKIDLSALEPQDEAVSVSFEGIGLFSVLSVAGIFRHATEIIDSQHPSASKHQPRLMAWARLEGFSERMEKSIRERLQQLSERFAPFAPYTPPTTVTNPLPDLVQDTLVQRTVAVVGSATNIPEEINSSGSDSPLPKVIEVTAEIEEEAPVKSIDDADFTPSTPDKKTETNPTDEPVLLKVETESLPVPEKTPPKSKMRTPWQEQQMQEREKRLRKKREKEQSAPPQVLTTSVSSTRDLTISPIDPFPLGDISVSHTKKHSLGETPELEDRFIEFLKKSKAKRTMTSGHLEISLSSKEVRKVRKHENKMILLRIPDVAYLAIRLEPWQPQSPEFFLRLYEARNFHQTLPYLVLLMADPESDFFQPFSLMAITQEVAAAHYPGYRHFVLSDAPTWPTLSESSEPVRQIYQLLMAQGDEQKSLISSLKLSLSEQLYQGEFHPGLFAVLHSLEPFGKETLTEFEHALSPGYKTMPGTQWVLNRTNKIPFTEADLSSSSYRPLEKLDLYIQLLHAAEQPEGRMFHSAIVSLASWLQTATTEEVLDQIVLLNDHFYQQIDKVDEMFKKMKFYKPPLDSHGKRKTISPGYIASSLGELMKKEMQAHSESNLSLYPKIMQTVTSLESRRESRPVMAEMKKRIEEGLSLSQQDTAATQRFKALDEQLKESLRSLHQ